MKMDIADIRMPGFVENPMTQQIKLGIGEVHVSGEAFFETNHPGVFVDKNGHTYMREADGSYRRLD